MSRLRFWPDPALSERSDPVEAFDDDLTALIADILDEMYIAKGRGLAAPQIGVMKRVFVVDDRWKHGARGPRAFVNPEITAQSQVIRVQQENCLSIPGQPRRVARPEAVELRWQDSEGELQRQWFEGDLARIVQHDLDHLNGITILDHPEAT